MKKSSLYLSFGLLAAIIGLVYSCKKVNGFDNGQIIETPFSIFFADSAGALYKSNDGINYVQVFPPDGQPSRALITSGENILWCKNTLVYSTNNGANFNQAFDSLQFLGYINPSLTTAYNGFKGVDLNQSMIVSVPGSPNLVYLCSAAPNLPLLGAGNYLGVAFNDADGAGGFWSPDDAYDTVAGSNGAMPVQMVSFALMPNGYLLGLAVNPLPDGTHFRNFFNTSPTNYATSWQECTGAGGPLTGAYSDTSGSCLPPNITYPNDSPFFTLGSYNNAVIAIDERGKDGAWQSADNGHTWTQMTGTPANVPLLCIYSPFNQVCLMGTDGAGLYFFNENTYAWQQNVNGLTNNLVIRGITAKENVYRDNSKIKYVFMATNQGIYKSTDMGNHWTLAIKGNFVSIY